MLDVLIEDQKKRSSEFRYLSDILDESFDDMEATLFENSFELSDGNVTRIKEVNEDKFKMAAFLAKLIQRTINYGAGYRPEEILKIYTFFKGRYYIKHFFFWEKILTLFWISKRKDLFNDSIRQIKNAIARMKFDNTTADYSKKVRSTLSLHLDISIKMSVNLDPTRTTRKSLIDKKCVIRDHYAVFPFLPYCEGSMKLNIDFTSSKSLDKFKKCPQLLKLEISRIYKGKTFYWCYLSVFFYRLYNDLNLDQDTLLRESLSTYNRINGVNMSMGALYDINEIKSLRNENRKIFEISSRFSTQKSKTCRIALLNEFISENEFVASLKGKPRSDQNSSESLNYKFDVISEINDLDVLVRPELAISYPTLFSQVRHSAKYQYSLTSGIQFISTSRFAYNCIVSTLPIRIDSRFNDCIPIIRLKNKYSYEEERLISKNKLERPSSTYEEYYLLRCRGIYFTFYYCFELTSIENRAIFKSMVDLVIVPIWNKDSFYFRAIADSIVRDLHCYYAQCNTSQFPESRISQPTKSLFIEKTKVRGGTISHAKFNFSLIVSDLDMNLLRLFQKMSYNETLEKGFAKNNKFKPLPPNWSVENVKRRIAGRSMTDGYSGDTDPPIR